MVCRAGGQFLVEKLTSLANTQVFLLNTDPMTIAWGERCLGTRITYLFHQTVEPTLPPPLLIPNDHAQPGAQGQARRAHAVREIRGGPPQIEDGGDVDPTPRAVKRILTDPAAP